MYHGNQTRVQWPSMPSLSNRVGDCVTCSHLFQSLGLSPSESGGREGRSYHHSSSMNHPILVLYVIIFAHRLYFSASQEPAGSSRQSPTTTSQSQSDSMPGVREKLSSLNIRRGAQDIIMSSFRSSTQSQYNTYLNKWTEFAIPNGCRSTVTHCTTC